MDPSQKTYHNELKGLWVLPCPQILNSESTIGTAFIKSLCFIFTILAYFIHSTIKLSKYYFVFTSLIFVLYIVLYSCKETSPRKLFPGAIPWRGINTEKYVIRGSGVIWNDTNPPLGSVSASVIPSRPGWSRTSDPFVCLQTRKRWGPNNYSLYIFDGVFGRDWYEFQLKCWYFFLLFFFSAKLKC